MATTTDSPLNFLDCSTSRQMKQTPQKYMHEMTWNKNWIITKIIWNYYDDTIVYDLYI